jgi:hypothetical protein
MGKYFIRFECLATTHLTAIDAYFRRVWLDCCGHMSTFAVGDGDDDDVVYDSSREGDWENEWSGTVGHSLHHAIGDALLPGAECTYEFDMGSTTYMKLRVLSARNGVFDCATPIKLLSRNAPIAKDPKPEWKSPRSCEPCMLGAGGPPGAHEAAN